MPKSIFFSVGEPSGDVHAASLIAELKRRSPSLDVRGYGGPEMARAGCRLDYALTDLAVMGLIKVVPHLARFYRVGMRARKIFQRERPDAVVLVDFPGFNWWIARFAHAAGVPVFYYLPPQIWAWATHRVEKMRRYVDHILCAMPFEPAWYAERGLAADYVGHPIFDEIAARPLDAGFLDQQRTAGGPVVGILPGSRRHEVEANFPAQIDVMKQLARRAPGTRFLVANYKEYQREICATMLAKHDPLPVELHAGKTSEIIELADACLMVSGSVSLELLARATPACVLYRSNFAFEWFCRYVVNCNYISLPNMFAERMLMPEYYIAGPTRQYVSQMVDQLTWWLRDEGELRRRREQMAEVRRRVAAPGAIDRAADVIAERMGLNTHMRAAA